MTSEDIIDQISLEIAEWSEMTPYPDAFIARVLAGKIVQLNGEIEYLKRRLEHECATK